MLVCLRVRPHREGQSTRQRVGRRVRVQGRFSWVGFACALAGKMEIRKKRFREQRRSPGFTHFSLSPCAGPSPSSPATGHRDVEIPGRPHRECVARKNGCYGARWFFSCSFAATLPLATLCGTPGFLKLWKDFEKHLAVHLGVCPAPGSVVIDRTTDRHRLPPVRTAVLAPGPRQRVCPFVNQDFDSELIRQPA